MGRHPNLFSLKDGLPLVVTQNRSCLFVFLLVSCSVLYRICDHLLPNARCRYPLIPKHSIINTAALLSIEISFAMVNVAAAALRGFLVSNLYPRPSMNA
jgi:hypothetical protein